MSARTYAFAVAVLGMLGVAEAVRTMRFDALDPVTFLILVLLAAAAQRMPVLLFRSSAVSVSFAAVVATIVLYGTPAGVLVSLAQAGVNAFTPTRKPFVKVAFNMGAFALSAFVAGGVFGLLAPRADDVLGTCVAVTLAALGYFVVNSALTSTVIAIDQRMPVMQVWRSNYAWMPLNFIATAVQGVALAIASRSLGPFGVIVFALPLAVAWYSFHLYMAKSSEVRRRNAELQSANDMLTSVNDRLEQSHLSVIGALFGALEAKDDAGAGRAARTMASAVETAVRLGCDELEVAAVRLGALFHDIGTIAVPETILRKPGPLTADEMQAVRAHPTIGANLLAHVPTLASLRPIVLAHHERYDGAGYPQGLRESEIPLAAQIIAVAEAYEAMTTKRVYRSALAPVDAVRELRANAGTQFNPVVVEAFIEQLPKAARRSADSASSSHLLRQALETVRASVA